MIFSTRKGKSQHDTDYTSSEILDLLLPKINLSSLNLSRTANNCSINDHRYSFDAIQTQRPHHVAHKLSSEHPNRSSTSTLFQNNETKSKNKTLKALKRPVTSIEKEHSFDLRSGGDCQRPSLESYCGKMAQSIIFNSKPRNIQSEKMINTAAVQNSNHSVTEKTVGIAFRSNSSFAKSMALSKDQFIKLKFLGKGKFGEVDLVMHRKTGFICAMKAIDKQIIKQEKMESQILKQIKIHASLLSKNVVTLYGFFDDPNSLYILLEYALDGSVLSLLKGKTRLEQKQVSSIMREVSYGIKYIQKMGYLHRDLKPQNIVMSFNVPKICDFGWATSYSELSLCQSYCGTPLYLSPQMIKKQGHGISIDIWAIGLLTYELLVGRVAFSIWSENDLDLILTKQVKIPEYIERSQECEDLIERCLEKDVRKRISIEEVVEHNFFRQEHEMEVSNEIYMEANRLISRYFD